MLCNFVCFKTVYLYYKLYCLYFQEYVHNTGLLIPYQFQQMSLNKNNKSNIFQIKRLSSASTKLKGSKKELPSQKESLDPNILHRYKIQSSGKNQRNPLLQNFMGDDKNRRKHISKIMKPTQKSQDEKILIENSDKMKLVYLSQKGLQKNQIVVISVDLIMNQDNFWKQQSISPENVKDWKLLHKKFSVVWIIRRQCSLQKLKQYCSYFDLALQAVFLIKRKGCYTINYNPVFRLIEQINSDALLNQILVLQAIKVNERDLCGIQTYFNRVPIVTRYTAKICLIRIDSGCVNINFCLNCIKNLTTVKSIQSARTSYNQLSSIPLFIQKKINEVLKDKNLINKSKTRICSSDDNAQQQDEEYAKQHLETLKRKMINEMILLKGRDFKIQGNSIHYAVGNIFKRNYEKLLNQQIEVIRTQRKQLKRKKILKKYDDSKTRAETSQFQEIPEITVRLNCQYFQFYQ